MILGTPRYARSLISPFSFMFQGREAHILPPTCLPSIDNQRFHRTKPFRTHIYILLSAPRDPTQRVSSRGSLSLNLKSSHPFIFFSPLMMHFAISSFPTVKSPQWD